MDQMNKMPYDSLESFFIKNMKKNTIILTQQEDDLLELFSTTLQKGFEKAYHKQLQSTNKIKYIAISFLLSSIVSENYSFGINFYDEQFYLDENDIFIEFKIPYIFEFIKENVVQTRKLLAYHRQPYKESDLVDIQKIYALSYIGKIMEMLQSNISSILSRMQVGKVQCEDVITVTLGAYMEQQMEIYDWEVG